MQQRVPDRQHEHHALFVQQVEAQLRGRLDRLAQDAGIDTSIQHAFDDVGGVDLVQVDGDIGMRRAKLPDRGARERMKRRRTRQRDPHGSKLAVSHAPRVDHALIERIEDRAGIDDKSRARRCQLNSTRQTREQREPQLALKLLNLLR
jgi:hypothetical protein